MDKLVTRVTVIRRDGDETESVAVYRKPAKKRRRDAQASFGEQFDRVAKRFAKAQIRFGEEFLRRQKRSKERDKDGWMKDAPGNIRAAAREAFSPRRKKSKYKVLPTSQSTTKHWRT